MFWNCSRASAILSLALNVELLLQEVLFSKFGINILSCHSARDHFTKLVGRLSWHAKQILLNESLATYLITALNITS